MSIELHRVDPESIMEYCYNYYMSHKNAYDTTGNPYCRSLELSYKEKYDEMVALKEANELTYENLKNIVHGGWFKNICGICEVEARETMIAIDGGQDHDITICKKCASVVAKLAEKI